MSKCDRGLVSRKSELDNNTLIRCAVACIGLVLDSATKRISTHKYQIIGAYTHN